MSFKTLLSSDAAKIILVNLHYTAMHSILPDDVRDKALTEIHARLGLLSDPVDIDAIKEVFGDVIFRSGFEFQLRAVQRPSEDERAGAVVAFDKVKTLLRQIHKAIFRDHPDRAATIQVILHPHAPSATVAEAAPLINEFVPLLAGRTFSDANRIWWGAPLSDIEPILTASDPAAGARGIADKAHALRDRLGLCHINPGLGDVDRHLFLFRTRMTLAEIRSAGQVFASARPSTLDGFDNPRFSQRLFRRPWRDGWGMTVDLTGGGFGVGLPEMIATQISLSSFECAYVGELTGSDFGPDRAYLATLAAGGDVEAMAEELDAAVA